MGTGLGLKAQWALFWGSGLSGHCLGVRGSAGTGSGFSAQRALFWGSGLSGHGFGVQGSAGSASMVAATCFLGLRVLGPRASGLAG